MTQPSEFTKFVRKDENARLVEQERLILAATELLHELMQEEGVSKASLAKRLGKSRASVTQLLSGSRNMTLRSFAELSYCLGHRIDVEATPLRWLSSEVSPTTLRFNKSGRIAEKAVFRDKTIREWVDPSRSTPHSLPTTQVA